MDNELLAIDTEETDPCAGLASPGTTLLSTNYPITSQLEACSCPPAAVD